MLQPPPVAAAAPPQAPGAQCLGPLFLGSDIYRGSSYGGQHPLRVARVPPVIDLCRALGWLPPGRYRASPRAKAPLLALWHDPDYLAALQQAEDLARAGLPAPPDWRTRYGLGTLSNPLYPEMFRRPATGAGGMIWAADALAAAPAGVVHVPGAGTHHGLRGRAAGFCYLNDLVLGIVALQRAGLTRIAYVDIDAHHGDGVELAFAGQPGVLMISVHEEARWPFTGGLRDEAGGNAFNLPVPRGFNDTEMRAVLDRLIVPRVAAHRPQAIVLQCGADALAEDPLARLGLSNRAHLAVVAALRPLAPRLIVTGGGGYNPWSVARCWAAVWGLLSGQDLPDRLPPDAAAVLAALHWHGGARPRPGPALLETLVDAPREGPLRPDLLARLARLAARPAPLVP